MDTQDGDSPASRPLLADTSIVNSSVSAQGVGNVANPTHLHTPRRDQSPDPQSSGGSRDNASTRLLGQPVGGGNQAAQAQTAHHQISPVPPAVIPIQESHLEKPLLGITNPSFVSKVGHFFLFILVAGPVLILGSIGFLAFLWFGSERNSIWHAIMIRDWLSNAVTICAEIIKQAVTFQIGVAGAMLAALALERYEVLYSDAASMTMIRAGSEAGSLLSLAKMRLSSMKQIGCRKLTLPILMLTMAIALVFVQVITILLVSDIGLSPIPGGTKTIKMPFGFNFYASKNSNVPHANILTRGTNWLRQPFIYPAFAEYSEPPYVADGVSDTGVTLRAFLPYAETQKREALQKYDGKTTVLDARVTCQVPALSDSLLRMGSESDLILEANVSASVNTPRLANGGGTYRRQSTGSNTFFYQFNHTVPVACLAGIEEVAGQWRTTLCQLEEQGAGGLVSEFRDLSSWNDTEGADIEEANLYGTAYLVLNVTSGDADTWRSVVEPQDIARPPAYAVNGEWMDLIFSGGKLVLSITLCYSGFNTADIPTSMSSSRNRTEPAPVFYSNSSKYNFDAVRKQYGQESNTADERGILAMSKQSWIAAIGDVTPEYIEPFIRKYADFSWPNRGEYGNSGNFTGYLSGLETPGRGERGTKTNGANDSNIEWLEPDPMHVWFFQEIVSTGGSVAFALQSLITLLSGMAYYDQIGQFDKAELVSQAFFITTNVPQRKAGFLAVVVLLGVHLVVFSIIVFMFWRGTKFSLLDNAWFGLAQASSAELKEVVDTASMVPDKQIKKRLKGDLAKSRVGLAQVGRDQVQIVLK